MSTRKLFLMAIAISALTLASISVSGAAESDGAVYVAHLHAMNTQTTGTHTTGEARFQVKKGQLIIRINVKNAPPNMVHWQHFHGFKNGQAASCPSADADANGDGIIDLIETHKASGTTMVPFISDPASMDVAKGTYPKANAQGDYSYEETVSLAGLQKAFGKAFPGQKLNLDKRVVYIHGVPASTKLPGSVQSLGSIPAQVTLPIACGKIERSTPQQAD